MEDRMPNHIASIPRAIAHHHFRLLVHADTFRLQPLVGWVVLLLLILLLWSSALAQIPDSALPSDKQYVYIKSQDGGEI
jgi:hypothetical protein